MTLIHPFQTAIRMGTTDAKSGTTKIWATTNTMERRRGTQRQWMNLGSCVERGPGGSCRGAPLRRTSPHSILLFPYGRGMWRSYGLAVAWPCLARRAWRCRALPCCAWLCLASPSSAWPCLAMPGPARKDFAPPILCKGTTASEALRRPPPLLD